ncbi:MAG TPA: magnesium transporter [Alphaproteobacteria bacterium]|nr:magnesium transporter [Alphaproteobacteria bacterium]
MTEPATTETVAPAVEPAEAEIGLDPALIYGVVQALDRNDAEAVRAAIADLHYSDVADLIEALWPEHRAQLVEVLRRRFPVEVIPELDEEVRDQVAAQLGTKDLAAAIVDLESDDALYLIEGLEEGKRRQVLHAIPAALRRQMEEALAFPEKSAGRLMQREVVAVPQFWTVGQCIDDMRESDDLPHDFYDIFVVDPKHRPVGWVPLDKLIRSKRPVKIGDIMEHDIEPIPVDMDQEKVAFLFKQHDLTSAPVVDKAGRLLGTITVDDVVDVIEAEAEEDLLRLHGVAETDVHAPLFDTVRSRFIWLFVNLATAFLASSVIGLFEDALQQIVALAVLMPITASMGGNAGTQTMAVAVRALATRELTAANALRILAKEVLVGGINGVLFAIITGALAGLWFNSWMIALCIGGAMILNLLAAGFAGIVIPMLSQKMRIDPAVSSTVILTTVTDVVGFISFLGLATLLLL